MNHYRRYKNLLEMFLASNRGRRLLNIVYSWGAAIVILGALFKLLHLPMGNEMLFIGMVTEFLVFFISGFEKPTMEYRWEDVFPELDSNNPMDREEMEQRREYLQRKAEEAATRVGNITARTAAYAGGVREQEQPAQPTTQVQSQLAGLLPEEQIQRLSEGIDKLAEAGEQLARIGRTAAAMTECYEQMQAEQEGLRINSQSYVEQMENLSRNITGLNTIYEIQLKSISSQIDTIDRINRGLSHIRDMYESTVVDSSSFRNENERMARQLSQLNEVYARLLQALTSNVGLPGMPGNFGSTPSSTTGSTPL